MHPERNRYIIDPDGVPIALRLDDFDPGMSFFVPCLNLEEAKKQIRRAARKAGARRTVIETRIENGFVGLRCWRWQ